MKNLGLSLTANGLLSTKFVLMRRVLALFILLAGAIQFMECGAEFLSQSKASKIFAQASLEDVCSSCAPSQAPGSPAGSASDHNCHLFCANHCASHHLVEVVELSPLRDTPSRALTFGQYKQVSLTPLSSVFEPPRS
ncbi:MAG: hypothetical protein JST16_14575 [Bdellovibrionales bacterium]|nr:hypothetical protein [Bdellovibrionales bacterium]